MKIIAPTLAEIKKIEEEKLVSLDVLKLYQGQDVVRQNPEDLDSDRWLDEGELKELPEVPREEVEVGAREQPVEQGRHELQPEPALDIPIITKDPEEIAEREWVHKRTQAEIQHEGKEAEEVILEILPEQNAVQIW